MNYWQPDLPDKFSIFYTFAFLGKKVSWQNINLASPFPGASPGNKDYAVAH